MDEPYINISLRWMDPHAWFFLVRYYPQSFEPVPLYEDFFNNTPIHCLFYAPWEMIILVISWVHCLIDHIMWLPPMFQG